jgi:hypothetical protein
MLKKLSAGRRAKEKKERESSKRWARISAACNGYVGIVVREPGHKAPWQAINGR